MPYQKHFEFYIYILLYTILYTINCHIRALKSFSSILQFIERHIRTFCCVIHMSNSCHIEKSCVNILIKRHTITFNCAIRMMYFRHIKYFYFWYICQHHIILTRKLYNTNFIGHISDEQVPDMAYCHTFV